MYLILKGFIGMAFFAQKISKYVLILVVFLLLTEPGYAVPIACAEADRGEPIFVGTIPSDYQGYLGRLVGGIIIFPPVSNFSMYIVPGTTTAASWRIVRSTDSPEGSLGPDAPGNTLVPGGTLGNPLVLNNLSNFEEQNGAVAYIDSINGTATLYQICSNTPFPVSDTTPSRIPTMSEWGLGLMALGLLAVAGLALRRRAPGT